MVKKYVSFELDKTRNLRISMLALNDIESYFKKPFSRINYEELTVNDLGHILCAGLKHEDAELTATKVLELVDEYSDFETAFTKFGEALAIAFGKNAQGMAIKAKTQKT
jgi:hypothetical protein